MLRGKGRTLALKRATIAAGRGKTLQTRVGQKSQYEKVPRDGRKPAKKRRGNGHRGGHKKWYLRAGELEGKQRDQITTSQEESNWRERGILNGAADLWG